LDDGRIAGKATAEWLREQGLAVLNAHLQDSPSIAALKSSQTQGKKPDGDEQQGELSKEELAVCKNMGISPDDFKKSKVASA
jgi:phage I-like protein